MDDDGWVRRIELWIVVGLIYVYVRGEKNWRLSGFVLVGSPHLHTKTINISINTAPIRPNQKAAPPPHCHATTAKISAIHCQPHSHSSHIRVLAELGREHERRNQQPVYVERGHEKGRVPLDHPVNVDQGWGSQIIIIRVRRFWI
jgi:hypothetical protein